MTTFKLWMSKFLEDRNGVLGAIILLIFVLTTIFAPYIAPYSPIEIEPAMSLKPPSLEHFFGTDRMGKDVFSRVIYGARMAILISGTSCSFALFFGTLVGLISGYYEGFLGVILMRLTDIIISLPQIVMALVVLAALGPGIVNAILALAVTYWPFWTRIVYADILILKKSPFVEALKCLGASAPRIIFFHMLPNILPNIITRTTISLGGAILVSALLSYVGLGVQPPQADWGLDLAASREFLPQAWWWALFPGLAIFVVVVAFNMVGDTLRDVLDPRLRRSGRG